MDIILTTYPTDEGKVGYAERAVKEDTVGQFSTLRDKNGKEIYAGDIIRAVAAWYGLFKFMDLI